MMKTHYIIIALLMCLAACQSPVPEIVGEYDFKVSGYVTIDGAQIEVLPNEAGVLNIIHLEESNYMLTFNTTDGGAYTTEATISGNQVELNPFARVVTLINKTQESNVLGIPIEITKTEHYNTEVFGSGTVYDDVIHLNMQYAGEEFVGSKQIKGNNILMIANKR